MKVFKILIVVCILISIGVFISTTDMDKVVSSLEKVGYNFITLIIVTFVAYFLAAIGWKFCLGKQGKNIQVGNLFIIRHIGETIGFVNPASIVGGEAVKIYMLKDKGIDRRTVLTSVLLSRLIMILSQLMLFFAVAVSLFNVYSFSIHFPPSSMILGAVLLIILILVVIIIKRVLLLQPLQKVKAVIFVQDLLQTLQVKFLSILTNLDSFLKGNKKALVLSFICFLGHWILGALEFYFILKFLDIRITVFQAILIDMGVVLFKSAGAFIPGQLGIEEYGNKVMLSAIGVHNEEIWISASLLRRARQLFWIGFALFVYFIITKKRGSKLSYI